VEDSFYAYKKMFPLPQGFISNKYIDNELLNRFAIFYFANPNQEVVFFCTISIFKSVVETLDNFRNCRTVIDIYSHLPVYNGNGSIKLWRKSVQTTMKPQLAECYLTWAVFPFLENWKNIDTSNIFKSGNVNYVLALDLVNKCNETAGESPYTNPYVCQGVIRIEKVYDPVGDLIVSSSDYSKLLTCYEEPKVSFHMYVSPFSTLSWIIILLQATALWTVFYVALVLHQQHLRFSPFLFTLGTLIDEPYGIPSEISRLTPIKLLIIPWMLMSMLLCSFYQSSMVGELNLPLKGQRINSLDEAFCPLPTASYFIAKGVHADAASHLSQYWRNVSQTLKNRVEVRSVTEVMVMKIASVS